MQPDQNSFLEGEALRLAQQGNATAFEFLYRLHRDRVHALCLRTVKNPVQAEDLTQETSLAVRRGIHEFRGQSAFTAFTAWLHQVTRNTVPLFSSQEKARGNVGQNLLPSAGTKTNKLPCDGECKGDLHFSAESSTRAKSNCEAKSMAPGTAVSGKTITRKRLVKKLNEDLARECQAIIFYVVYSQVLKGSEYKSIAQELEKNVAQSLRHALTIAKQIEYLGGSPRVAPKSVKVTTDNRKMMLADLKSDTIRNYRERVRQCEKLEEYAMAELIREILVKEQEQISDLATALGIQVPNIDCETDDEQ
jgi:bacterioferritin